MSLIVIDPGLSTTVQDAGRPGHREWGIGPGGAFDRGSADLANALAANPATCAVLEMTLTGGIYEAAGPLAMAMAGAPMEAKVIGPDGTEQRWRIPSSGSLRAGDRLILGPTRQGARTYLAVRGGWQTRPRLGSRSSEARLKAGEILPAAATAIPTRYLAGWAWQPPAVEPFRIIDGPDAQRVAGFDECWTIRRFRVAARSDRMGLRLEGEPIPIAPVDDRLSAPVAAGAIQWAGGQLIVLGVACGTMGGYPHIGHVISADLDRLGQLGPGDVIAFQRVALEIARQLDQHTRHARAAFLNRVSTMALDF